MMPAMCVAKATTSIDFRPMKSTIAPPMMTDSANPQKAMPVIQPMFWLSNEKSVPQAPMMSPRTAKVIAVAISAMQLATNKRLLSAADRAAVPAPLACALKASSSCLSLLTYEHKPLHVRNLPHLVTHRLTPSTSMSGRYVEHSLGRQHARANDTSSVFQLTKNDGQISRR